MIGKIYITSTGYDPQLGKHVNDPHLGPRPTLGACRPDIRRVLQLGDHIFVISGKVPDSNQFLMGGFQIAEKITPQEAYIRFPELRLRKRNDGQVTGNVAVDADGNQHPLDNHSSLTFDERVKNYVVGTDPVVLSTPTEVAEARQLTVHILQDVFKRKGDTPHAIIGRCSNLTEQQVQKLRDYLNSLKRNVEQTKFNRRVG